MAITKKLWRVARLLALAGDIYDKEKFKAAIDEADLFLKAEELRKIKEQHDAEMAMVIEALKVLDEESDDINFYDVNVDPFYGYVDDEDPEERLPYTYHDDWAKTSDREAHQLTLVERIAFDWCRSLV